MGKGNISDMFQGLPFDSIIGTPLKTTVEAQAMAAETSLKYIRDAGLQTDSKSDGNKASEASFCYSKDGRVIEQKVPLLAIVPVPYLAIDTIDINFKDEINSVATGRKTDSRKVPDKESCVSLADNMEFCKADRDSKYSIEYTMDVAVKCSQEDMPAGLSKVLEMLGNSLNISDPSGTLEVNVRKFSGSPGQTFPLIVTYKNPDGLFEPDKIYIQGLEGTVEEACKIFHLPVIKGMTTIYVVNVSGTDRKIEVSTTDSSAR